MYCFYAMTGFRENMAPINVREVEEKLECGQFFLKEKEYARSLVWQRFLCIVDRTTKKLIPFALCKYCGKIYKCDQKSGTSSLIRHECLENNSTAEEILSENDPNTLVTAAAKARMTEAIAQYCAEDMRPYNFNGRAFHKVVQTAIELGAEFGMINTRTIMPDASTISSHATKITNHLKNQILSEIKEVINCNQCAATINFWTDDSTKTSYYSLTIHYVHQWKLRKRVLFVADFPDDLYKDVENVRKKLETRLFEFGIEEYDSIKKLTFITEQGGNIVKALEDCEKVNCVADMLNLTLKHSFDHKFLQLYAPATLDIFATAKKLVTYFRKSEYRERLSKQVQQEVETRWCSRVKMLSSVIEIYDEIVQILKAERQHCRIDGFKLSLAKELVALLQKFDHATVELQNSKKPTSHMVLIWYHRLLKHCNVKGEDDEEIKKLKNRIREELRCNFKIHMYHKIALFLHPDYRRLRMLPTNERIEIEEEVKRFIDKEQDQKPPVDEHTGARANQSDETDDDSLMDDRETRNKVAVELNEVHVYKSRPYPAKKLYDNDLLEWWENQEQSLPILSKLASKIFAIPATSALNERICCAARFNCNEKRSLLDPETVEKHLFLRSNS